MSSEKIVLNGYYHDCAGEPTKKELTHLFSVPFPKISYEKFSEMFNF